jgi:hypothetical protein
MSNPLTAALVALALGIVVGGAVSWSEFRGDDLTVVSSAATAGKGGVPDASPGKPRPRLIVEETTFDFGTMQRGETRSHSFTFTNAGNAPLTLEKGSVSCTCTLSKLENNAIPPGGSAQVTLEWTPRSYALDFRQTAEIRTNDPERLLVTLSISGRVLQIVRPVPEDLTLTRVAVSEPKVYTFKVLSYRDADLQLKKLALHSDKLASLITLEDQPLSAEELAAEKDAKGGRKVTVTLKPGLPLGPLAEAVHIETNLADVPPIEVPLRGSIVSDISLAPRADLDLDDNFLRLGPVRSTEGKTTKLFVMVRGKLAKEIKLKVGEIDPADGLKAEIGEGAAISEEVYRYPLTLTVPVGAPSMNRLGGVNSPYGKVVIETSHPTAPRLILSVRFAVE